MMRNVLCGVRWLVQFVILRKAENKESAAAAAAARVLASGVFAELEIARPASHEWPFFVRETNLMGHVGRFHLARF